MWAKGSARKIAARLYRTVVIISLPIAFRVLIFPSMCQTREGSVLHCHTASELGSWRLMTSSSGVGLKKDSNFLFIASTASPTEENVQITEMREQRDLFPIVVLTVLQKSLELFCAYRDQSCLAPSCFVVMIKSRLRFFFQCRYSRKFRLRKASHRFWIQCFTSGVIYGLSASDILT